MLKAKVINITPEIALEMLQANTENYRSINHRKAETYAREMSLGMWQENGEPIQFYEDGTLANGQHRLKAIVMSGETVPMLVVNGVKKDVKTYDRGGLRTIAQTLKAYGMNIDSQESSALSILKNGFYGAYGADEIREYSMRLKDFDIVSFAINKGASHPIMKKAGIIAAAYCAYRLNSITLNELEQFAIVCNSGIPTETDNCYPSLCLRKTIQNGFRNQNGEKISGGSLSRICQFETAYKAFSDFHNGFKRKVSYKPDGTSEKTLRMARKVFDSDEKHLAG